VRHPGFDACSDVSGFGVVDGSLDLEVPGFTDGVGATPRTLYRFIDEGDVPAYKFGRVIRPQAADVEGFIERCPVEPGTL